MWQKHPKYWIQTKRCLTPSKWVYNINSIGYMYWKRFALGNNALQLRAQCKTTPLTLGNQKQIFRPPCIPFINNNRMKSMSIHNTIDDMLYTNETASAKTFSDYSKRHSSFTFLEKWKLHERLAGIYNVHIWLLVRYNFIEVYVFGRVESRALPDTHLCRCWTLMNQDQAQ